MVSMLLAASAKQKGTKTTPAGTPASARARRPMAPRRVKDRRGRGAYGNTGVFDIFERQGQVYTEIEPDCSRPTLQGIIRGRRTPRP